MPTVTTFDLILMAVAVLAALGGAYRGAAAQFLGFGGAAGGLVAGLVLVQRLAPVLADGPGTLLALLTVVVIAATTMIGRFVGASVGSRCRARIHEAGASGPDRIAGVIVGLAGFVLVSWLLGAALSVGPVPAIQRLVRDSRVLALIDREMPPPPDLIGRVAVYLDQQGFPQVYTGPAGVIVAPSVAPPDDADVAAAAEAGRDSTVQVEADGCGRLSLGSGVVTGRGEITTSAHVIAGTDRIVVRDAEGEHDAVPVLFDPRTDLAVLRVADLTAPVLPWSQQVLGRDAAGAVLGFPGGQRELDTTGAVVRARTRAVGRDIYGTQTVERQVLTLAAEVRRGGSGGPFVTADGAIGGIVFAASAGAQGTSYALEADWIRDDVEEAGNTRVATGQCRFSP